jgi:hypothetical protein
LSLCFSGVMCWLVEATWWLIARLSVSRADTFRRGGVGLAIGA